MSVITLLTDFGLSDSYVGIMKGVILSINPDARIIDISHEIGPQDVAAAAYALLSAYRYFPAGTIHVLVVDPGVGSSRRIVVVKCRDQFFVAPDNGVLTHVIDREGSDGAVSVENPDFFLHPVSRTFHGRDIFAPVAAHLSKGLSISDLGPAIKPDFLVRLDISKPVMTDAGRLSGSIVTVDRFGNLITNIARGDIRAAFGVEENLAVMIGPHRIGRLLSFYGEVDTGMPMALFGSGDMLEISVRSGNASRYFGLGRNAAVEVYRMQPVSP